jgi:1,2-diacylglycerol 3-beta-glucosyltransferase
MTNGANISSVESAELVAVEVDEFDRYERRRLKAAVALALIWSFTAFLHIIAWGQWVVYGLTVLTGAHMLRLLLKRPAILPSPLSSWATVTADGINVPDVTQWPLVSLLIAAKNEVVVIERLIRSLMAIDYPTNRFDVWIINDNSTDGTGEVLDRLAGQYPNLFVVHREATATGGKSGALNEVWPQTRGDFIGVFDADAQVASDCLRGILPMFEQSTVGAVQLRKAIANGRQNFWTQGQVAEMAFDAYCQMKRVAGDGIGELRGNGQFVRRQALEHCGGWTEETITDDLDLTFKLHLTGWDVALMMFPAVWEEGVVRAISLWHQRNRWAEGGYQRYLDYWGLLTLKRLGRAKLFDMFVFWLLQYGLPTAALPDFALAIARNRPPIFMPISSVMVMFVTLGMATGLWRTQKASPWKVFLQTLRGMVYMMHWFIVVGTVTLRMAVRAKRLKWVKTQHGSLGETPLLEVQVPIQ